MPVLLLLVMVAVVVGIAVVAAGLGEAMPDAPPDRDGALLPEHAMERSDIQRVRFSLGFRGYRMDEVDDVLDRLADEIEDRDRRIAELEAAASQLPVGDPAARARWTAAPATSDEPVSDEPVSDEPMSDQPVRDQAVRDAQAGQEQAAARRTDERGTDDRRPEDRRPEEHLAGPARPEPER